MDVSAKAHAFVADLDRPELSGDDDHHLRRVLRLQPGDAVTAGDGAGRWRRCRLTAAGVEAEGETEYDAPLEPELTVAFALVKGERPEWVVQKLTELGIDRVVPFTAERSVARWDEHKAAHHHARFVTVARLAAMQSRRTWLPVVEAPQRFDAVAGRAAIAIAERGGEPPSLAHPVVAIGPEGGWSVAERAHGLPTIGLGPNVLRAETAALSAASVLVALRARLIREVTATGGR